MLVAYNVPKRDCGQHSSGGAASAAAYRDWIDRIAAGIGAAPAVVVLEPDALAGHGLPVADHRRERIQLLKEAVDRLSALPATSLYIDAGNPGWVPAARMARRLRAVGVGRARGFAVNVSAFETTERARAYGRAISRRTGRAHFVIDTSRNGAGPVAPGDWCNPSGRALGACPTTADRRRAGGRLPVGQAPRRVGRHLQRRPSGRHVVARVRARPGPAGRGALSPLGPPRAGADRLTQAESRRPRRR